MNRLFRYQYRMQELMQLRRENIETLCVLQNLVKKRFFNVFCLRYFKGYLLNMHIYILISYDKLYKIKFCGFNPIAGSLSDLNELQMMIAELAVMQKLRGTIVSIISSQRVIELGMYAITSVLSDCLISAGEGSKILNQH